MFLFINFFYFVFFFNWLFSNVVILVGEFVCFSLEVIFFFNKRCVIEESNFKCVVLVLVFGINSVIINFVNWLLRFCYLIFWFKVMMIMVVCWIVVVFVWGIVNLFIIFVVFFCFCLFSLLKIFCVFWVIFNFVDFFVKKWKIFFCVCNCWFKKIWFFLIKVILFIFNFCYFIFLIMIVFVWWFYFFV